MNRGKSSESTRDRFLENVGRAYTPIVRKILTRPQFSGESSPGRVLQKVVQRFSKKRKGTATVHGRRKSMRKLIFNTPAVGDNKHHNHSTSQPLLDEHTEAFLMNMASTWRQHRRNHDREAAATVLQLTLKAIPKGTGRVSDWLGPKYFDEIDAVTAGCAVRLLKKEDIAQGVKFRNSYEHSGLGKMQTSPSPCLKPST